MQGPVGVEVQLVTSLLDRLDELKIGWFLVETSQAVQRQWRGEQVLGSPETSQYYCFNNSNIKIHSLKYRRTNLDIIKGMGWAGLITVFLLLSLDADFRGFKRTESIEIRQNYLFLYKPRLERRLWFLYLRGFVFPEDNTSETTFHLR